MNAATLLYVVGSFAIFLAERTLAGTDMVRFALLGLGGLCILMALGARTSSLGRHPVATKIGLGFTALSMSSGLFYLLQLKDVISTLGMEAEQQENLRTAFQALIPLVWVLGALPAFGINRTLAASPHSVHPLRVRAAWEGGLAVALGVSMLFPLNWLAHEFNHRWDFGFFRTTRVGEPTFAAVESLSEPVHVVLFYPPSSDTLNELTPYFDELEGSNLSYEVMDHAMAPELAKEWKVRDNGNVVLVMGEKTETIKLAESLDKAKKDLKKLDSKVRTALLKISREKRTAYFTVGHDELYWKNAPDELNNLDSLKKVLEALQFKVKELGIDDGLAQAVPDDAAIVFVVGPKKPFFAEEVEALQAFRDQGGALFLMLEPTSEDMSALAALVGVSFDGSAPLASDKMFLPLSRGIVDRLNVGTNKFTSHESVTTLSKRSSEAVLITPSTGSISELESHAGAVTITVKGMPDWFRDGNGNLEFDASEGEKRGGYEIAAVAKGPAAGGDKTEWHAAVVADATMASNFFLRNAANAYYIADTVSWLTQDAALAGESESEEDVKIQHTKEDEAMWFYATSGLIPALVFVVGALRVSGRRKKGAA
jgi:hypothetical protein